MSYRSIKRVLGETSLERKCLFLFGICLLTLITLVFWWYSSQTDELVLDATRRTAAGLKRTILFREHLKRAAKTLGKLFRISTRDRTKSIRGLVSRAGRRGGRSAL